MTFMKTLSVGDGITSDYLDFTDHTRYVEVGGDWGIPEDEQGVPLEDRVITRRLRVLGDDMDAVNDNIAALETKLNQARMASGRMGGTWVTLGVQTNTSEPLYFDVKRGRITDLSLNPQANNAELTLELYCLPYARGDAVTLDVTGTITNTAGTPGSPGNSGSGAVYLENVPGTAPALCQVLLIDASTGSQIINRVRIGVAARPSMTNTDWLGWMDGTPNSPGTAGTAHTNRVGSNFGTVVTSDAFQDVIDFSFGTAGSQRGEVDIWARAMTSADMVRPSNLAATLGNGDLAILTDYTVKVTSLDASGAETDASDAVTKRTGNAANDRLDLTWTPTGVAVTDHRVYYIAGTVVPTWRYQSTGSAAGTFNLTTNAGGTANPPSVSGVAQPYLRTEIGLASLTRTQPGPALPMMNAGTTWAMQYQGLHIVPPWHVAEGQSDIAAKGLVRAVSGAAGYTPWVRIDCVVAMPPWPQIVCEYPGLTLATQREWLIDTDRAGYSGCLLRSKADQSEQGQADVTGQVYLLPGDNLMVIIVDVAGGVSDVVNAQYTVRVTYRPRFKMVRGSL